MTFKRKLLVVANVTATSPDLRDQLVARAQRRPTAFTLVVPATPFGGGPTAATGQLDRALEQLRAAGLEIDGQVGDSDPIVAVSEAWDPHRYDEIVVSTLPVGVSHWLHADLPRRIERTTGAPVTHLVSAPEKPVLKTVPPPEPVKHPMGPLSVLDWVGNKQSAP